MPAEPEFISGWIWCKNCVKTVQKLSKNGLKIGHGVKIVKTSNNFVQ